MEINELSRRNDELMTSKDSDNVLIRDLDNQLKEYKRKYEQAKTELRSMKGVLSFLSAASILTDNTALSYLATVFAGS